MLRIGIGFGLNRGGVLPPPPPPSTDFIIKVKTDNAGTSEDDQFTLPTTTGTYDYQIDWGDGVIEDISVSTAQTHTYPTEGTYTIKISGTFPRIFFNNGGDKSKLIEIVNLGDVSWTSMERAFWGCNNMDISPTCTGVMPSGSYQDAWQNCSSLTSFPALDLSVGNNFFRTWQGCSSMTSFNATALGSGSFRSAWQNCSSLTSFPALDLSVGNNFQDAWAGCTSMISFNATELGSGNYQQSWLSCSSLTSFPALDLSGGTSFFRTWEGCSLMASFNATELGSGNYQQSWLNCSSLTSFPALDLSGGTSFQQAWQGCSSMTSFNATALGSGSYQQSWQNCSSLTSFPALDLSGGTSFFRTWRNMGAMTSFATRNFYNMTNGGDCFAGTTLPTSDWSDILVTQRANNSGTGISFHGGNSKYNTAGGVARGELVTIQSWSIIDGGAE